MEQQALAFLVQIVNDHLVTLPTAARQATTEKAQQCIKIIEAKINAPIPTDADDGAKQVASAP